MSAASPLAALGGIGGGVLAELIGSFLGGLVEGVSAYVRTEIAINLKAVYNWSAEAFDGLLEGEPDATIGMAPSGMLNVLERFLRATAQIGIAIGAEVAEELFMELIQEGFSNAIQTSMGGAFQTMLNVWRGGAPPSPDELDTLVGKVVDMDEDTLALMIAMTGSNLPTTFYRVSRGFDMYVDDQIRLVREQLIDVQNRLNHVIAWLYEVSKNLALNEYQEALAVIKESYTKAINLLDAIGERALSRLQELKTECETAKAWFDYSTLYPETPLITETEVNYVATENKLEAEATFNTYNRVKTIIENTLANVDVEVDAIVSKINDVVAKYAEHLNKLIEAGTVSFSEDITKIQNALQKVIAYRNAKDTSTKLESPVQLIGEDTVYEAPGVYSATIYVEG